MRLTRRFNRWFVTTRLGGWVLRRFVFDPAKCYENWTTYDNGLPGDLVRKHVWGDARHYIPDEYIDQCRMVIDMTPDRKRGVAGWKYTPAVDRQTES